MKFGKKFQRRICDEANEKNSRMIFDLSIALPIHDENDQATLVQIAVDVLEEIEDLIPGVMVNRSFGDAVGIIGIEKIIDRFSIPFVADYKLCETDRNTLWMASELYEAGFEALTIPAFVGKEPIKAVQEEYPGEGIILTASLPHLNKSKFMDKAFDESVKMAKELGVDGVDVAGNHLEDVERARKLSEDLLIFASGFETSHASPGDALRKECDFEVISRAIYESKDPRETAIRIMEEQRGYWEYDLGISP